MAMVFPLNCEETWHKAEWEQVSEAAVGKTASTIAEEITAPGRKRSRKTEHGWSTGQLGVTD